MIVTIYRLCVDGDMENRKPHVVLFTGAPETVCFLPPSPRKKKHFMHYELKNIASGGNIFGYFMQCFKGQLNPLIELS